jgi:hypothetical protein
MENIRKTNIRTVNERENSVKIEIKPQEGAEKLTL